MGKIFVCERRHAGRGTGRPRFALETIAAEFDAKVVYLPRGEQGEQPQR